MLATNKKKTRKQRMREQAAKNTEIMKAFCHPRGWDILVEMYMPTSTCTYDDVVVDYATGLTRGDFQIAISDDELDDLLKRELVANCYARVLKIGDLCYKRMGKLNDEDIIPYCKPGDLIYIASYAGKGIYTPNRGETFLRWINDEDVAGVVDDELLEIFK